MNQKNRQEHTGTSRDSLTLQVERLAAVVPQFLKDQPQHGAPQPGLLPLRGRLVVQEHHVRFAPLDKFLLVLVVGDDGADGQVALLQPPEHEARDGQVDGRLDVRGLVQLVGSAVQQEQRAGPGLQLLLQPLHALTRHHHHSHDRGASPRMINSHQGNVNPPPPRCDMRTAQRQNDGGGGRGTESKNHGAKLPFPRPPPPPPPPLLPPLLLLRAHRRTHAPNTHFPARTHIQHARSDAPALVGAGNLNVQRFLSLLLSVGQKWRFHSSPSTSIWRSPQPTLDASADRRHEKRRRLVSVPGCGFDVSGCF